MKETKWIYYRENAWQSITADFMTFGMLAILGAFDHFVLNDSKPVAVLFFFVFLTYALGKASGKKQEFTNLGVLKDYINKL